MLKGSSSRHHCAAVALTVRRCPQCHSALSLTQYAGKYAEYGILCLQCLFEVSRPLTSGGKRNMALNVELEFSSKPAGPRPFVV